MRLLLVLALAAPLATQAQDRWQPVRDSIRAMLVREGGAGLSVAVAKDGRIIWEEGFGWANRERRIPATEHTMFSLASISKPITATGLMVLAQRGAVALDRPANDYLGATKLTGLGGDAAGATVRRVLSHTAGLPLHYQFFYANEARQPPTRDETIARYGILTSAPGEVFRYSNLGYGIIDYLISRASGQSYADFMRQEVFIPLGLTHTSVDVGPGLESFAAERYGAGAKPIPSYTFDHPGGSAVWSSAHDLVRFGMFHLKSHLADQRAILPDSAIDAMQRPVPGASIADTSVMYGLGWFLTRDDHGYAQVEHSGGMPGVATELMLYPAEHVAIVVLTNGGGNPRTIAQQVAGVVLPRYAAAVKAERAARPASVSQAPAPFRPAPELAGTWEGTIRTWQKTLPMRLTFEADGDVKVRLGPEPKPGEDSPDLQLETLVNFPSWQAPAFEGLFAGAIRTPDVYFAPHMVRLDLRLANGVLRGTASAENRDDPVYYSVASYVELRRRK